MGRFNDRRSGGGNRSFGGGGNRRFGGGGRDRDERPRMFGAICSDCGKECEVPFKPTDSKPVYCSECFESGNNRENRRNDRGDRRGGDRGGFGGRRDRGDRQQYDAICDGCGQNCQVPFKPTSGKPVYCDDCFSKDRKDNRLNQKKSGSNNGDLKREIDMINIKLDTIMALLTGKEAGNKNQEARSFNKKNTVKEKIVEIVEKMPVDKKNKKITKAKKSVKNDKATKSKTSKKVGKVKKVAKKAKAKK